MASSKGTLEYVMDQLSELAGVSYRAMMGEYILYYEGKVVGGIYDDRLLVKITKSSEALIPDAPREIPYEGAKEMFEADIDRRELLCTLIPAIADDLPEPKKKRNLRGN